MNKKIILLISMFIFVIGLVKAEDLSDYPDVLLEDNEFEGYMIVGETADTTEVIAAIEIASSLNSLQCDIDNIESVNNCGTGILKLDTELDNYYEKNIIAVGTPCSNEVVDHFADYPEDCSNGLDYNKAKIKLNNINGKYQLIVTGYSK